MVYTPMMYGKEGGMSDEVRESRKRRSLLGTEGSGESLFLVGEHCSCALNGRLLKFDFYLPRMGCR